jgi:hypothetical protein
MLEHGSVYVYIYTNILASWNKVLLEKIIITQIIMEFDAFVE